MSLHLTRIAGQNIKGFTFDTPLTRATMIIGENWSGKTSMMEAIRLALLGHLPRLGKQPSSTFDLSSGLKMEVGSSLSDGTFISRTWSKSGDRITAKVAGNILEYPPILLDATEYFSLSVEKRMKYVFSSIALGDSFTVPAIMAHVKNSLKFEQNTVHTEAATATAIAVLDKLFQKLSASSVQDALSDVITTLTEERKLLKQAQKRMSDGIAALNQLSVGTIPVDLASAEAGKAEVDRQIAQINTGIGELKALQKAQSEWLIKHDRLTAAIASHVDRSPEMDKLKTDVQVAELSMTTLGQHQSTVDTLATAESTARSKRDSLVTKVNGFKTQKLELQAKHKPAQHCPNCQHDLSALANAQFDEEITKLDDQIAETITLGKTARAAWDEAVAQLNAAKELDKTNKEATAAANNLLKKARADLDAITKSNQAFEQARRDLAALGTTSADDYMVLIGEQETKLHNLNIDSGTWATKIKQAMAAKSQDLQRKKAREELDTTELQIIVANMVIDALVDTQSKMVADGFGRILHLANRIVQPFTHKDGSPFVLECRDGDVGCYNGKNWAPFRCFSGAHETAAFAAISVSLAVQSPMKLVLLDEMTTFSQKNKTKFATQIMELINDNTLDQFIGIDTDAQPYQGIPGLNVITIS